MTRETLEQLQEIQRTGKAEFTFNLSPNAHVKFLLKCALSIWILPIAIGLILYFTDADAFNWFLGEAIIIIVFSVLIISVLPAMFIYYRYYLNDKNTQISIDYFDEKIKINRWEKFFSIPFSAINKIILTQGTHPFMPETYSYIKINFGENEEIIITSLVAKYTQMPIPVTGIERVTNREIFPII